MVTQSFGSCLILPCRRLIMAASKAYVNWSSTGKLHRAAALRWEDSGMGVSGRFWTPAVSRAAPAGNSFETPFPPIISKPKLLLHRYYRRPTDSLNGYQKSFYYLVMSISAIDATTSVPFLNKVEIKKAGKCYFFKEHTQRSNSKQNKCSGRNGRCTW